jgi:hypothetical protein
MGWRKGWRGGKENLVNIAKLDALPMQIQDSDRNQNHQIKKLLLGLLTQRRTPEHNDQVLI